MIMTFKKIIKCVVCQKNIVTTNGDQLKKYVENQGRRK